MQAQPQSGRAAAGPSAGAPCWGGGSYDLLYKRMMFDLRNRTALHYRNHVPNVDILLIGPVRIYSVGAAQDFSVERMFYRPFHGNINHFLFCIYLGYSADNKCRNIQQRIIFPVHRATPETVALAKEGAPPSELRRGFSTASIFRAAWMSSCFCFFLK